MDFDTTLSAQYAGTKLDQLVNRAHRDTLKLVENGDIPLIVKHFMAALAHRVPCAQGQDREA